MKIALKELLIEMAKKSLPQYGDLFPSECVAVLLVEHFSDTEQAVKENTEGADIVYNFAAVVAAKNKAAGSCVIFHCSS